jgi:chromosome segregation ATPase
MFHWKLKVRALFAWHAEIMQGLRSVEQTLEALRSEQEFMMAKIEDVRQKVAAANRNLDAIGNDVRRLKDLISSGQKGLNEAEADEALSLLAGIEDRTAALDAETPEDEAPPAEPA